MICNALREPHAGRADWAPGAAGERRLDDRGQDRIRGQRRMIVLAALFHAPLAGKLRQAPDHFLSEMLWAGEVPKVVTERIFGKGIESGRKCKATPDRSEGAARPERRGVRGSGALLRLGGLGQQRGGGFPKLLPAGALAVRELRDGLAANPGQRGVLLPVS